MGEISKIDGYIELYDELVKFKVLKNFIKDRVRIDENGRVDTDLCFVDNLVDLIKYTDKEFYNEVKGQQGVEQ